MSYYVKYNGSKWICHAEVRGDYEALSYFSREDTIKFLDTLKAQESFEYEIPDDFEPHDEKRGLPKDNSYVKIKLKTYDYSYLVMMGTLIKGLNEHRKWAYPAMLSGKPYFVEAQEQIRKLLANKSRNSPMNAIGGHQYIMSRYNYQTDKYEPLAMKFKRRTIRGVFRLHSKLGPMERGRINRGPDGRPMGIWATYLGEPA